MLRFGREAFWNSIQKPIQNESTVHASLEEDEDTLTEEGMWNEGGEMFNSE